MTKDFKYGIIFGLPILIVGVVYFVLTAPKDTPATQATTQPATNEPVVAPADDYLAADDTPAQPIDEPVPVVPPVVPETPAVDPPVTSDAPAIASADPGPDEVSWTADNIDPAAPAEAPADDPGSAPVPIRFSEDTPARPSDTPSRDAWGLSDPAPVAPPSASSNDTPASPVISAVDRPEPVAIGAGRKYVVQRGDLGYWYIAEKVYGAGNGKHWKRIAEANPQADSNALRPGQVLTVPPLPARETTAPVASEDFGRTTTTPGGQKVYIVSKEDTAGLWGISKKVWGKGHLWEAIQKANPQIDPSKLRPGMKLVIPDRPDAAGRTGGTSATATRTTAPANQHGQVITDNGRRYYIVAAGDRGYWGIAAKDKVYGAGKYSYLIHQANPGVNSDNLQPGDKLLIPPRPAGSERAPAAGRTPRRRIEPVPEDVPDFGG